MQKLFIRNLTNILIYVVVEFYRRSDGNAQVLITFLEQFQKNTDGCEDLSPTQYIIFACKLPIVAHKIVFPPAFSAFEFTTYKDEDMSMLNVLVMRKSQAN